MQCDYSLWLPLYCNSNSTNTGTNTSTNTGTNSLWLPMHCTSRTMVPALVQVPVRFLVFITISVSVLMIIIAHINPLEIHNSLTEPIWRGWLNKILFFWRLPWVMTLTSWMQLWQHSMPTVWYSETFTKMWRASRKLFCSNILPYLFDYSSTYGFKFSK